MGLNLFYEEKFSVFIDLKKRDGEKTTKILRELMAKHRLQIMDCSAYENYNIDQVKWILFLL